MGECGDAQAAAVRGKWAERMWAEVSAELARSRHALDSRVAAAIRRLWRTDGEGRLRSWAPGTAGPLGGMELEGEMRELLEAVAGAGSWAVWMGVFDRGWMRLLEAGGMSYQRARRLTKRLCRVIQECRAAVAKRRNERQREVSKSWATGVQRVPRLRVRLNGPTVATVTATSPTLRPRVAPIHTYFEVLVHY